LFKLALVAERGQKIVRKLAKNLKMLFSIMTG